MLYSNFSWNQVQSNYDRYFIWNDDVQYRKLVLNVREMLFLY